MMKAIQLLVQGKTDTELLEAIVKCLTDNEDDLIAKLHQQTNYSQDTVANLKVLAAIVHNVAERGKSRPVTGICKCMLETTDTDFVVHVAVDDFDTLCGAGMAGQSRWKIDAVPDCPRCLAMLHGGDDETTAISGRGR